MSSFLFILFVRRTYVHHILYNFHCKCLFFSIKSCFFFIKVCSDHKKGNKSGERKLRSHFLITIYVIEIVFSENTKKHFFKTVTHTENVDILVRKSLWN